MFGSGFRVTTRVMVAAVLPFLGAVRAEAADTVSVRLWPPSAMQARIAVAGASPMQTERFDALTAGSQSAFTSTFGGGAISGTYSGDFTIRSLAAGNEIDSGTAQSLYTLTFHHDSSVPGVNFFGLDVNGLDAGNTLTFLRNLSPVASFTGADLATLFGTCGGGSYCGNPNAGQSADKAYGYLGFTDQTGLIDQIELAQNTPGTAFDTDNHTVAYVTASAADAVPVPEPSSIALLAIAFFGLAASRTAWATVGTPGPLARLKESQHRR